MSPYSEGEIGAAAPKDRVRILIDCASISMANVVTGIPRVVFKYLEYGAHYSRRHGVTVLPVYVTPKGIIDARFNLPPWAYEADTAINSRVSINQIEAAKELHRRHVELRVRLGHLVRKVSVGLRLIGFDKVMEAARRLYHRRRNRRALALGAHAPVTVEPGDILFMPSWWHDEIPASYLKAKDAGALIVPLLHDLLPVTMPKNYDPDWRIMFHRNVLDITLISDHMMYVSDATRREALAVFKEAGIAEPPHSVHHHGGDFLLRAMEGENSRVSQAMIASFREQTFRLLVVGTIEPKKNHLLLLSTCRILWELGLKFQLVIIGRPGWRSEAIEAELRATMADPQWNQNVVWFQNASDEDLAFAYSNSQLCVLPSQGEGFGLPLVEALTRKVPVVASDIPVFREIAGDHAMYFDLKAPINLLKLLCGLVRDPERLADARRRTYNFRWPTWETQCEKVFDLLCHTVKRLPAPALI